jgi:bla regulator protein blaR1
MFRTLIAACMAFLPLHGQSFDVASVRPHDPADKTFVVHMPAAGHFTAEGAPVNLLVMLAYGVQESQIAGGPAWFGAEKWDINAKCDDERHSGDETKRMLQHLLEERFSLKIHREAQQRPVYIVTVAKGGPKFRPSEKNATNIRSGAHSISMERASIAGMTGVLATALGRPVVDRTELTGLYDLSVVWDDAPVSDGGLPGTKALDAQEGPAGDEHGSIFTAVREQLGLRLEASRAAVEVLVVDSVQRPGAN